MTQQKLDHQSITHDPLYSKYMKTSILHNSSQQKPNILDWSAHVCTKGYGMQDGPAIITALTTNIPSAALYIYLHPLMDHQRGKDNHLTFFFYAEDHLKNGDPSWRNNFHRLGEKYAIATTWASIQMMQWPPTNGKITWGQTLHHVIVDVLESNHQKDRFCIRKK